MIYFMLFVFAILFLPLHAYFSFNLAFPMWLRAPIFQQVMKAGIITGLDIAGFFVWGGFGHKVYKWYGLLIFFLIYLAWGLIWHWKGLKKLEEIRLERELSPESQKTIKELDEIEKELEDESNRELDEDTEIEG